MPKIKVLIIDDSALIRNLLTNLIQSDDRFEVCGAAQDPYVAREMIKQHNPDVLTLDIEMPRMNGITFLKNLMRLRPMPVVMVSTLTHEGAPETLEALALGAVDFVGKPKQHTEMGLEHYRQNILAKLFAAASANLNAQPHYALSEKEHTPIAPSGKRYKPGTLCAIGSSTGGTEALKVVLGMLPADCPPIVIAQHIPEMFSASLARRLDASSAMNVYEAKDGQTIEQGNVYLAKGGTHLKVINRAGRLTCLMDEGDLVNRHKPSVEVLFDSAVQACGRQAMSVMLTGMGADGSHAMLRMRNAGCHTIAQDEKSSVVWGMPGVAVDIGGAVEVLSLTKIANAIMAAV